MQFNADSTIQASQFEYEGSRGKLHVPNLFKLNSSQRNSKPGRHEKFNFWIRLVALYLAFIHIQYFHIILTKRTNMEMLEKLKKRDIKARKASMKR